MTHPITPPLGWVLGLLNEARKRAKSSGCFGEVDYVYMVNKSAQWGWDQRGAATEAELQQRADQELKACCEYIRQWFADPQYRIVELRAARRPKPPSLKEQALRELGDVYNDEKIDDHVYDTIRRALEALPND